MVAVTESPNLGHGRGLKGTWKPNSNHNSYSVMTTAFNVMEIQSNPPHHTSLVILGTCSRTCAQWSLCSKQITTLFNSSELGVGGEGLLLGHGYSEPLPICFLKQHFPLGSWSLPAPYLTSAHLYSSHSVPTHTIPGCHPPPPAPTAANAIFRDKWIQSHYYHPR